MSLGDVKLSTEGDLIAEAKEKVRENYKQNKLNAIAFAIEETQRIDARIEKLQKEKEELASDVKELEAATTLEEISKIHRRIHGGR